MKVKTMKILKSKWAFAALVLAFGFTGCSDWTEVEADRVVDYGNTEPARPESYYQALREWKKSEHSVSFGWFSDWVDPGAQTTNMLAGVPDSMDLVSLWGGWSNLTPERLADVRFVQEKKGTKVFPCTFTSFVGQNFTPEEYNVDSLRNKFWGWDDAVPESIEPAIRKYAQAMVDTIKKYRYDGIDIDYEPHFGYGGRLASYPDRMHILIEELGKHIGPMSQNPELLLIVDGEPQSLLPKTGKYISYFVIQAYSGTSGNPASWGTNMIALDNRLNRLIENFVKVDEDTGAPALSEEEITNRNIMCENLEPALESLWGGYEFKDRSGHVMPFPSMVGMAVWEPLNGFRKGGFGAYRFSNEAVNKPAYKWMRTAIQRQNPAYN